MPTYSLNGKKYIIPSDVVKDFEKDNPDAKIQYSAGGKNYDVPVYDKQGFLSKFPDAKYRESGEVAGRTNKPAGGPSGNVFTQSELEAMDDGQSFQQPAVKTTGTAQEAKVQPTDAGVLVPMRAKPYLEQPFKQQGEEARQQIQDPQLTQQWVRQQDEAMKKLTNPAETPDFGERMDAFRRSEEVENARRVNRSEFDKENFGDFYSKVSDDVQRVFDEEREAGNQKAREANKDVPTYDVPGAQSGFARLFERSVNYERETDPEKIIGKTLQRVQSDEHLGDYVLRRMGITGQSTGEKQGNEPPLTNEEKKWMEQLFSQETSEVAGLISQKLYDQYKKADAPDDVIEYIAGKAFHENFAKSLFDAMVRRAAGSSGIRQQLRALASEEYGQSLEGFGGWSARMAGGAAPFAMDVLTGGFMLPNVVGQALVKGGTRMAVKAVTQEMAKRATARGLENAALKEAVSGSAAIAERYLQTQAPIMNIALRTAGSAANFATYDVQSEVVRQLSEGEFRPADLIKQAVHGAAVGGAMGAAGGTISHTTRNSGLFGKLAGGAAGVTAETGIFAASNGIAKAQELGIPITDVDWADTTGEALGMVVGMKAVAAAMHPSQLLSRYRQSKDLGLQLNQQDIDELKRAGYDFDGLFKGLGKFGEVSPQQATVINKATEYTPGPEGTATKRPAETTEAYVDSDMFNAILSNPFIMSSTKRKLVYVATGKLLPLEPAFGATMDIDDTGKAVITTTNAYGNVIESKAYKNADDARKDYELLKEQVQANTIGGLERIAEQSGHPEVMDIAKARTQEETGVDVDNIEQLAEAENGSKVLDAYVKNLQDAYVERFNEELERIATSEHADGGTPVNAIHEREVQRSERRNVAYNRGVDIAQDISQLLPISYDVKLAEARMASLFPDSDPQAARLRTRFIEAIENDNDEEVGRLLQQYGSQLSAVQREAIEQYGDMIETRLGVSDAITLAVEAFSSRREEELNRISNEGTIIPMELTDGSQVYHLSGDWRDKYGSVMVTTADGTVQQISTTKIKTIGESINLQQQLIAEASDYEASLKEEYSGIASGRVLPVGSQIDIAMSGNIFNVTVAGSDEQGNVVIQMPDGSTMAMTSSEAANAVSEAMTVKVRQQLLQERDAEITRQRTARFEKGIAGYKDGMPDLANPNTDVAAAAEYLLSQRDESGKTIVHTEAIKQVEQEIAQMMQDREQVLQALHQARNNYAMAEEGDEMELQSAELIRQLEPQLEDMAGRQHKWGEIRYMMMTPEERSRFEGERIKAIGKIKTQSQKEHAAQQPAGESAETFSVPTGREVAKQFSERSDAENFVDAHRKELSQRYRTEIYPQFDDVQKQLANYQKGYSELTPEEIKALTDQQVVLEDEMGRLVAQQNAWKELSSSLGRLYAAREREKMNPHELAMSDLSKETDKVKKVKLAQEAFKDDPEASLALDNMEPQDVYEWVAANLGANTINWEGIQRGEHYIRGLRDEMGRDKTRGIGSGYDTNGFNQFLAPTGEGKGIDEIVHDIAEGSPYDTSEVKNALLDMLSGAKKPTDISHRIIDDRIAQAEQIYESNHEREAEAERQAQMDADAAVFMEMTGMTAEEYDAYASGLEERLAEQEDYRNSEEYFKNISEHGERENEGSAGGGSETSALGLQRQESGPADSSQDDEGGTGKDSGDGEINNPPSRVATAAIQGLENYTEKDVTDLVAQHFAEQVDDAGIEIVGMKVIGSRTRGEAKEDSDLDVLLEYKGRISEDGLFNILNDEESKLYIEGIPVDINPITKGKSGTIADFLERNKDYQKEDNSYPARLAKAKAETNTEPTEAQKQAGNYKMGHISFGGYQMSIENPKGSTRRGVDGNGRQWSIEMQDTYGYIGRKYGADGDHLDFFINDDADLDKWNGRVFVIDQKNEDGTFDEHKVMYGYTTLMAARKAYERNYEPGWWDKHVIGIMGVRKENFDKWLNDSDHKRKPFAEYYRNKTLPDAIKDPTDQLLSDVEERKNLSPIEPSFKSGELEKMTVEELKQLRKKRQQDLSTAKVMSATIETLSTEKDRKLRENAAQAEADIKAIDAELSRKMLPKNDVASEIDFMVDDIERPQEKIKYKEYEFGKIFLPLQADDVETVVSVQRSTMSPTAPWRDGVEDVTVHTTLPTIQKKYGELHQRAKKGDTDAADELVTSVVKPEKIAAIVAQHPEARVAYVHAEEATGRNTLPVAYAHQFKRQGLQLSDIVQTNKPEHTGSDRAGRFIRRARFNGEVESGREYIIVDDHITMGSTLRDLKDYIESKGGKVVAVSTLTASAGGTKLIPTKEQIQQLNEKGVTNEQLREIGIADSIEGLTRREAAEILVLVDRRGNSRSSRRREESGSPSGRSLGETQGEGSPEKLGNAARIVHLPRIDDNGYNVNTPIGRKMARLKKEAGSAGLVGYTDSETGEYVFLGSDAQVIDQSIKLKEKVTGKQDGMFMLRFPADSFDLMTPTIVKKGYKVGIVDDKVDEVDRLIAESQRRMDVADKKEADTTIADYLKIHPQDSEAIQVRKRATKAVLTALDDAGVAYKLVSENEEREMLSVFSQMNIETIKNFARNPRIRNSSSHGRGRYIVFNMEDPFGVPMYAEKKSVAKWILAGVKKYGGKWAIIDIGEPGEAQRTGVNNAADMQAQMGWHGSHNVFTRFDHSHMGEGAGSQTFGWGTYLTNGKSVAQGYANPKFTEQDSYSLWRDDKKWLDENDTYEKYLANNKERTERIVEYLQKNVEAATDPEVKKFYEEEIVKAQEKISKAYYEHDFANIKAAFDHKYGSGHLYKVEMPDDNGSNYLEHYEKMRDQQPVMEKVDAYLTSQGWNKEQLDSRTRYTKDGKQIILTPNQSGADLYAEFEELYGAEGASKHLHEAGLTGIKYPAGTILGGGEGFTNYVMFDENDAKITEHYQMMMGDAVPTGEPVNTSKPVFVSNALKAIEGIKQEKGTSEQWLAMLVKNGGLKAGEDKWLGLSEWLNEHKGQKLTKKDIVDFIQENQIEIEEQHYSESIDIDNNPKMIKLRQEYQASIDKYDNERNKVSREVEDFNQQMYEKYGYDWRELLDDADRKLDNELSSRYAFLYNNEVEELALSDLVEKYGEDFGQAFHVNYGNGKLEPEEDMYGGMSDAAIHFLDFKDRPIDEVRLSYTTEGLDNKREIALTVPSIQPWNESDNIHFGDAGNGRAVAWIRFGDVSIPEKTEANEASERKNEAYIQRMKEKYGFTDDVLSWDSNVMSDEDIAEGDAIQEEYERTFNEGIRKVLVIDEIQSKRHQEGRERGYSKYTFDDEMKARDAFHKKRAELCEKYNIPINPQHHSIVEIGKVATEEEKKEIDGLYNKWSEIYELNNEDRIPDAPFDKNWHELAMKRMLRYAAENGYDKIAWTKGAQQAERYSLIKLVEDIEVSRWGEDVNGSYIDIDFGYKGPSSYVPKSDAEKAIKEYIEFCMSKGDSFIQSVRYAHNQINDAPDESKGWTHETIEKVADAIEADVSSSRDVRHIVIDTQNSDDLIDIYINRDGKVLRSSEKGFEGKPLSDIFGKEIATNAIELNGSGKIDHDVLRIGGDGMKGFYDQILPGFMNKYGKKWGVKVGEVELPGVEAAGRKMWSVDVTPEMKESVMQGQPMFQREQGGIYGWTDGKIISLTKRGLNPNSPVHEYTHIWAKYMEKNQPELWYEIVSAMKKTDMWEQIRKNANYRGIWENENKMASEVLSRLSGAQSEEEFTQAAAGNKKSARDLIKSVKSALKKFWEAVVRMFSKRSKTEARPTSSLQAIVRMPLRDLLEGFNPIGEESDAMAVMPQADKLERTLMGVHNISEEKLRKALKLGGLANPSLAVIDTKQGMHTDFGDISLIPTSALIDTKTGRNAGTFTGDAYTATYPHVERMITKQGEKSIERIAKEAAGGDADLERHLMNNLHDYAEQNSRNLHLLYLIQKGLNPEIKQKGTTHSHEEYEELMKIFPSGDYSPDGLTKEQNDALFNLMMKGAEEEAKNRATGIIDPDTREKGVKVMIELRKKNIADENGNLYFAKWNNYFYGVKRDERIRQNPETDWYSTDINADYRIATEGLSEDYEKWKEQLFGDEDFEEKLFAGYDREGYRKYVPNTVENASRLMNRESDTNSHDEGGLNATRAQLLERMTTLSQIRKHRDLLQGKDEYSEKQKEMSDELFDIISQISDLQVISDNKFMNNDYAEARLQEAIGKRDPVGHLNKEYGYHIDKNGELASQIMNFIENARNLPVKYFETKFKRPVGLNEFAVAVVPETTSPEVIKGLKDAGLDVRTYDATGTIEQQYDSRLAVTMDAVGMRDDILFHIEENPETINRLDSEPVETGYRNVVVNEDGTLGSPMANRLGKKRVGRKATTPFEYGKWERSDEHPELATEDGKIDLIKPGGREIGGVDYNPYIHIRPTKVNKQFKQAWERPNLIYVETAYPTSELQRGYQAEKAALPVGKHPWGGGELILSRWDKPLRMVPWEEVADDWEDEFKDRGVEFDIVPPKLLPLLVERGIKILPPHKGMGKKCNEAYKAFIARTSPENAILKMRVTPAENKANTEYNNQLEAYIKGEMTSGKIFDLGEPSPVLKICGITGRKIGMRQSVLSSHKEKHDLSFDDLRNLPSSLYHPIMVYEWGDKARSYVIITELTTHDGRKVTVTIRVNKTEDILDIEKITSVHGKDLEHLIQEINTTRSDFALDNLRYLNKEKALEWLTMDPPKGSRITRQELISAAKIIKDSDLSKFYQKKISELYSNYTDAVADTANQLGGVSVVYEAVGPDEGTLGWYDPNDNSVHVVIPSLSDIDEAKRTVFHEKLGHEGLVALMDSQEEVNKFGQFIFASAGKTLRQRILDKADEESYGWDDPLRLSKAAQEVFADIAQNGPATEEEFNLLDKVKHYLIKILKKLNIRVKGLLNDHDLRYYVLKTGEALKRWHAMDETDRKELSTQSPVYDIMKSSRRGKPRKRRNESDAQYFQRLREWERWKAARDTATDNGDTEPTEEHFHEQAEADFKADMEAWKRQHGIGDNESFDSTLPKREEGESPQEYAVRIAEHEAMNDLWSSAPKYMDYLQRASEAYRQSYREWRERYDLEEEERVDLRLYEGDVEPEPTFTDAEVEAQALAEKDFADAVGMEVDEAGAKRQAKLAVIERRKNMESANAEDAIWIYDFVKMTDSLAKELSGSGKMRVTGKEIREAIPFLIEAERRRENLETERDEAVQEINKSDAVREAHTFVNLDTIDQITEELNALNEAWKNKEDMPNAITKMDYRDAARRLAERLNELHVGYGGYNLLYADDVMKIRSLLNHAVSTGHGDVMPPLASSLEGLPEIQRVIEHVKSWYDDFFHLLEDAGLRGDAGYISDGYVNHVWDKEKSDSKAWEKYIENRQRTKSPNMRHREIDTYMDGISIGLVPKYTDIADMIAHYSRQNNEAVANSRFLDDLKFVVVREMNDAGEVTAILPLIYTEKPSAFLRDRYAQYNVPGYGDIYVLKHAQKRFANVFGTMRTPDAAEWLSNIGKAYDITSSTAKKIQLALSGFHALALFEVDVAQNSPMTALRHLFKYIIADSARHKTVPAYAHPEDFQLAAKHLVQLGATEDYAAADVNAITQKLRDTFRDWYESDATWKKVVGVAGSPAAIMMDWVNKSFDTVLWNFLHDGLKLCAFKELAKQVDRRVAQQDLDGATREKLLDEAGQYVNDMFGGQYWELLNVSPATLKWMRRLFLSPDWLLSTQRHFLANFGFGSVYGDGGFQEYVKYNTDNIQRLLGKDVPHNELRRLRSRNAKICYLIGALVWWQLFYNAVNAIMRRKDESDEKAKAEEERKKNPNYKSPYELAYPDGMKWYDYTMYGNAIGQQTHLFTGRYSDGTETYVRWGKQFREFPELFIGRHGIEFPAPIIQRMMSKANPNLGTIIDFLGAQNIGGFNGSYENKELREKYGKAVATISATARHFIPFGIPTQADKEYKMLDFFMPSSKGFSPWKAKDYFETFILDGNWEGIEATYNACVMNGIDAEADLKAAISSIKATQRKELGDGVTDLSTAAEKFDTSTTPEQRFTYLNKIKKHLKKNDYKVFTRDEAIEQVKSFVEGDNVGEKENVRYVMLATSEDIVAEEKLKDLNRIAGKFKKQLEETKGTDGYEAMKDRYGSWLKIRKIAYKAIRSANKSKKQLGALHEDSIMDDIRKTIRDAQQQIDQLDAPR